jgi:geranylgeranyl pyrophosphate synthase
MMPTEGIPWLRCQTVEIRLREVSAALAIEAAPQSLLPEVCRYLLQRPGKNIRGALLLLSASFGKPICENAIRLAVAVELLHTATLYHDDVIDDGALRRGVPAPSRVWGDQAAVYAGGYLFSRAMELFAAGGDEISLLANKYVTHLWIGEMVEIENLGNITMPMARYFRIISRKTGSLFELPCRIGAVFGETSVALARTLGRFGRRLGVAFQMTDDLADFLSDESVAGKESGADLREWVCSIPVLHCIAQGTSDSASLERYFRGAGPALQLGELRSLLYRSGSIAFTKSLVDKYLRSCETLLLSLPPTNARVSLLNLTERVRVSAAS